MPNLELTNLDLTNLELRLRLWALSKVEDW